MYRKKSNGGVIEMDNEEWVNKRKVILDKIVEQLNIRELLTELHELDMAFIKQSAKE